MKKGGGGGGERAVAKGGGEEGVGEGVAVERETGRLFSVWEYTFFQLRESFLGYVYRTRISSSRRDEFRYDKDYIVYARVRSLTEAAMGWRWLGTYGGGVETQHMHAGSRCFFWLKFC